MSLLTHSKRQIMAFLSHIWSHHLQIVVFIMIVSSYVSFFSLPFLAQKVYTDEKALIIGAMGTSIGDRAPLVSQLVSINHKWLHEHMNKSDAVKSLMISMLGESTFSAHWHASSHSIPALPNDATYNSYSTLHTVISGGRGDGTESLVLAFPVSMTESSKSVSFAVAIAVQTWRHLASVPWLAKDVAIVLLDTTNTTPRSGRNSSHVVNDGNRIFESWLETHLKFLGLIQQGLVLDIRSPTANEVGMHVHGHNAQLPNMDMVALTRRNLDYYLHPLTGADTVFADSSSTSLLPSFPFLSPKTHEMIQCLVRFTWLSARGQPSGMHGALLRRGADTLTLTFRDNQQSRTQGNKGGAPPQDSTIHARGVLSAIEMILRTCNNLHERLHHSSALYVLLDGGTYFVNIGAYLIPPGILLGALLLIIVHAYQKLMGGNDAAVDLLKENEVNTGWSLAVATHAGIALASFLPSQWNDYTYLNTQVYCIVCWVVVWVFGDSILALLPVLIAPKIDGTDSDSGVHLPSLEVDSLDTKVHTNEIHDENNKRNDKSKKNKTRVYCFVFCCSVLLLIECCGLLLWRWALAFILLASSLPILLVLM